MAILLLGTDLDWTLTEEIGRPLPETVSAIQRFAAKGGAVLLASGRILLSLERVVESWGIRCHLAATNGAVLQTWPDGNRAYALELAPAVVERALELGEGHGVPHLLFDDRLYASGPEESESYSTLLRVPLLATPDLARRAGPGVRAVTWRCSQEEAPRLTALLARGLDGLAAVTASHSVLVDVNPRGADKGRALERVQHALGISPDETLSIGDSPNDLSLLLAAGHRACVGNAAPELKEIATFVAEAPGGRGALEAFRHHGIC